MARIDRALTRWGKLFWVVIFVLLTLHDLGSLNTEQVAFAQSPQPTQKPSPSRSSNPQQNVPIIDAILKLLQPQKRSGGSRTSGGIICAYSPVFKPDRQLLWTRQPVLAWVGDPSAIQLIDDRSKQIVWEKSIDSNNGTRQLRIDRPLELGKRYIWRVVAESGNDAVNPEVAFQMVDVTQWRKIDRELKALEQKQKRQKLSPEKTALERVYYFAQLQMWGDVQETLAVLPTNIKQNLETSELENKISDELSLCRKTK
jgi:hypothetical protein